MKNRLPEGAWGDNSLGDPIVFYHKVFLTIRKHHSSKT